MKLVIGDTKYDVQDSLQHVGIGDLRKVKTILGVDPKRINKMFIDLGARMKEPEFDQVDLLGDDEFLLCMQGLIFLARRLGGEVLTVDDAADTPYDDFHLEDDEPEATAETEDPGDPKAPTSSAPAEDAQPPLPISTT